MPRNITVTFEDGTKHVYQQAPDNLTPDQVSARAQQDFGKSVASLDGGRPAAVEAGSAINQIPRQLGLAARYLIEGPAQAAEIVTEPIRQNITDPLSRALFKPSLSNLVTGKQAPQGKPLGQFAADLADRIGLPKPEGANERVIADASRMVAGAGGIAGAGRGLAQLPGVVGRAGQFLGQNVGNQAISAAGAGLASGASREAGGDPIMQAVAGLAGGLAAPTAVGGLKTLGQKAGNFVANRVAPQMVERNVENTINLTLRRQGIDWAGIDARTKAAVRNDVRQALDTGTELDGGALRRLIDYRRVGATPTVGGLTLDPVQITREKNLSKIGANSSDSSLQQLAQVENRNNNAFINNLNDAGAAQAQDPLTTGETLIGALNSYAGRQQDNIGNLYGAARDSQGRQVVLNGPAAAQQATRQLQQDMVGKLPPEIDEILNALTRGDAPLTVEYQQQLVKNLYRRIQGAGDNGDLRHGLGIVRDALDNAPVMQGGSVNPGNLPAIPGQIPPNMAQAGQDAIDAFGRARSANRQFMKTVENTPALDAAMNGAAPDKFLSQFVTGTGGRANVRDVEAMASILRTGRVNPENLPATAAQIRALPQAEGAQAMAAVKNAIADHLKQKALGGAADEVGNFSQSAYNKALRDIGERKLALFFSPDEIAQLQAVGRVSSFAQFQPRGSAVNNSNSGALALGKGLDFLASIGSKVPLGLSDTITGKINGMQASRALNTSRGLLTPQEVMSMSDRLAPGLLYGGLLTAPQVIPNR